MSTTWICNSCDETVTGFYHHCPVDGPVVDWDGVRRAREGGGRRMTRHAPRRAARNGGTSHDGRHGESGFVFWGTMIAVAVTFFSIVGLLGYWLLSAMLERVFGPPTWESQAAFFLLFMAMGLMAYGAAWMLVDGARKMWRG